MKNIVKITAIAIASWLLLVGGIWLALAYASGIEDDFVDAGRTYVWEQYSPADQQYSADPYPASVIDCIETAQPLFEEFNKSSEELDEFCGLV